MRMDGVEDVEFAGHVVRFRRDGAERAAAQDVFVRADSYRDR